MNRLSESKAVNRVYSILNCFSLIETELTNIKIVRKTGIPKATLHRLLYTMIDTGMLEKHDRTNTYSIGPTIYEFGNLYRASTDLMQASEKIIKVINDLTKEVVSITKLFKNNVIIVLRVESLSSIRWPMQVVRAQRLNNQGVKSNQGVKANQGVENTVFTSFCA